jgi:hypothetical protein
MAYIEFAIAMAMLIGLYIGTQPKFWGWLLFLPLFLTLLIRGILAYRYSLTVEDGKISVVSSRPVQYPVSDITAVNVWPAKGGRVAVVTFTDRRKLTFPSKVIGFDDLVKLLRTQAKLPEPVAE